MRTQRSYAAEVEDLTAAHDAKPVLWGIDLKIPKGKLVAVVGPNGVGKTTLIKVMLGLLRSMTGTVRFLDGGSDVRTLKNRIGYVPQSSSADWDFPATVLDVMLMGCYGKPGQIHRPCRVDAELSRQMLTKVGMEEYSFRRISQLPGGQQQWAFLARVLAQEAEVYFMGEPFKGVDAQTERAIVTPLKKLKEQEKTVVVVHHDLQIVPNYFDWVTLIDLRVVVSGPVGEVLHGGNLKKTCHSSGMFLRNVG